MLRGFYSAANAMRYRAHEVEVISNNLANVNTDGYKADRTAFRSFGDLLAMRLYDNSDKKHGVPPGPRPVGVINLGGPATESPYVDFSTGVPRVTGNPFDLMLNGPGFFVVETPDGPAFTRAGSFQLDSEGKIVTQSGYALSGTDNQPIRITRNEPVDISANGEITQAGIPVARIRVVEFDDPSVLAKEGGTLFRLDDETVLQHQPSQTSIEQGSIEGSNVKPIEALVQLITSQRAYEAAARAVDMFNQSMQRVSSEVGRLPG